MGAALLFAVSAILASPADAESAMRYNVVSFIDQTGPESTLGAQLQVVLGPMVEWWNRTRGAKIGVQLDLKTYDGGSDALRVLSQWVSVRTSDRPIAVLPNHGVHSEALAPRMRQDKVPGIFAVTHPWVWQPNGWQFAIQPTYPEMIAAWLQYYHDHNFKGADPMKVGWLTAPDNIRMVQLQRGLEKWLSSPGVGGKIKIVDVEQIANQPTDLTPQVQKLLDAKVDAMYGGYLPQHVQAVVAAFGKIGARAPFITNAPASIGTILQANPTANLNQMYTSAGFRLPEDLGSDDELADLTKIIDENIGRAKVTGNGMTGIATELLLFAAVERVVKEAGPAGVTPELMYKELSTGCFSAKDLLGLTGDRCYDPSRGGAPKNSQVAIYQFNNGKTSGYGGNWVDIPAMDNPF